jgi:hypothetical protein
VDLEQLRQSLKSRWLDYYRDNRHWLAKLKVWVNAEGQRRPTSSFVLGTLSLLEPELIQMLPLIVDLNNSPDEIVRVLGLNFNPEAELRVLSAQASENRLDADVSPRLLPPETGRQAAFYQTSQEKQFQAVDDACRGSRSLDDPMIRDRP